VSGVITFEIRKCPSRVVDKLLGCAINGLIITGLIVTTPLASLAKTVDYIDDALEETDYLADALFIKHYREELVRLKVEANPSSTSRINHLQNRITHKLLVDFFEINSMVSELSDELDNVDRQILQAEDHRLRKVALVNISNFASTGTINIVGGSFGTPSRSRPTIPSIFGITAAATSVGLSATALYLSKPGRVKTPASSANVLTYVFHPDSTAPNFPLPLVVRDYLHRLSPTKTETRASKLITSWKRSGLLHSGDETEIAQICQTDNSQSTSLAVLRRRSAMLRSLRTLMSQTSKGMMKLAEAIDEEEDSELPSKSMENGQTGATGMLSALSFGSERCLLTDWGQL